jgi:hypothetical protein
MGSSSIRFQGRKFEANDATMEVLLALMVKAMDEMRDVPAWLREVRDDWHMRASEGFGFGVTPGLDRFATDDQKRDTLAGIARGALARLESYGEVIPREELNALQTGGEGATFLADVPAEVFVRPARYFLKLLEGKLEPWENDARVAESP